MGVATASVISRQEFFATTLTSQRYLSKKIEELVIEIQELQFHHARLDQMIWDIRRAEAEGLRVTFFETDDQIFFMVDAKGQIGFQRGGRNG